jgi:hypothetical protein
MTKFINDLNHDMTYIMELHHYVELEEMVHMTMKVERQLKQKSTIQQSQPLSLLKVLLPTFNHKKRRRNPRRFPKLVVENEDDK